MIYNRDISIGLCELFGIESLKWSKSVIRSSLEDKVHNLSEQLLNAEDESEASEIRMKYNNVKELDNEFTELYTQELTN